MEESITWLASTAPDTGNRGHLQFPVIHVLDLTYALKTLRVSTDFGAIQRIVHGADAHHTHCYPPVAHSVMLICLAFHIERVGNSSAQGLLCRADIPEASASVAQELPAYPEKAWERCTAANTVAFRKEGH